MGNVRMEAADRADIDMQGMGGARDPEGRVNQRNSSEQGLHGSICLDLPPLAPSDFASQAGVIVSTRLKIPSFGRGTVPGYNCRSNL